jgi:hypothetical protein
MMKCNRRAAVLCVCLLTFIAAGAITLLRSTAPTPPLDPPPATPVGVSRVQRQTPSTVSLSSSDKSSTCTERGRLYASSSTTSETEASSSGTTASWCLRGPTAERVAELPSLLGVDSRFRLVHIGGLGGWTCVIAPLCGGLIGLLLFIVLTWRHYRRSKTSIGSRSNGT